MWDFYTTSSCSVITWVVFVCIFLHFCPYSSQMWYWQNSSGSSNEFSGSLWWTFMRPEFIFGDGKLWSKYEWILYNYDSLIVYLFVSSNSSSSSVSFLMYSSCASIQWVLLLVFSIVFVWLYGSSKHTDFILVWWK